MRLDGTSMPGALAPPTPAGRRRRRAPFWRGAAGAFSLAVWSVAGVICATIALLPVALERGPRGRVLRVQPERSVRRLVARVPGVEALGGSDPGGPVPVARAAGESFPG